MSDVFWRKQALLSHKEPRCDLPEDKRGHSDVGSLASQECGLWKHFNLIASRRHQNHCLGRKWTSAPPSLFEQSFEILSCCSHQCFAIDLPEMPQAKSPHPMPLFRFSE